MMTTQPAPTCIKLKRAGSAGRRSRLTYSKSHWSTAFQYVQRAGLAWEASTRIQIEICRNKTIIQQLLPLSNDWGRSNGAQPLSFPRDRQRSSCPGVPLASITPVAFCTVALTLGKSAAYVLLQHWLLHWDQVLEGWELKQMDGCSCHVVISVRLNMLSVVYLNACVFSHWQYNIIRQEMCYINTFWFTNMELNTSRYSNNCNNLTFNHCTAEAQPMYLI